MRDFAVAILSAAVMGVAAGNLLEPPSVDAPPPEQSSQVLVGDEDPNVLLYRAVMGADSPAAPRPHVPLPVITHEAEWAGVDDDWRISPAAWSGEDPADGAPSDASPPTPPATPTIANNQIASTEDDRTGRLHDVGYEAPSPQLPAPKLLLIGRSDASSAVSVSP